MKAGIEEVAVAFLPFQPCISQVCFGSLAHLCATSNSLSSQPFSASLQ